MLECSICYFFAFVYSHYLTIDWHTKNVAASNRKPSNETNWLNYASCMNCEQWRFPTNAAKQASSFSISCWLARFAIVIDFSFLFLYYSASPWCRKYFVVVSEPTTFSLYFFGLPSLASAVFSHYVAFAYRFPLATSAALYRKQIANL